MKKKRIILDCDPGQDDAIAILLSYKAKNLEISGITTVCGTISADWVAKNALKICELAGAKDIPVYKGAKTHLKRAFIDLPDRHNFGGLGNAKLPEPRKKLAKGHAVDFIIDSFMGKNPPDLLVCTACFTNVALALKKQPKLAKKIPRIISMAGAITEFGNRNPVAESNIFTDPEAAKLVLRSGIPITMFPLDITHKILADKEFFTGLKKIKNKVAAAVKDILAFVGPNDIARFNARPIHDPTTIAYLIKPSLFKGKDVFVDVEADSDLTRGQTVVDWWAIMGKKPNVHMIYDVNAKGFFALLFDHLKRY